MIIDCVADLHGYEPKLEGGDLLILAGDYTASGTLTQWSDFFHWLKEQPYDKKILIAGNHDNFFESGFPKNQEEAFELREIIDYLDIDVDFEYLCDSGTEYEGLKIWGSPWTPRFLGINPKCTAFTYYDETWFYDEKVINIPKDSDILITHDPAYGIMDYIIDASAGFENEYKRHCGSKALLGWLKYVGRPKLHIFGHIHERYGIEEHLSTYDDKMMKSINCSFVNERYQPVNKPIRVIL